MTGLRKQSPETKRKMSASALGREPRNVGVKGFGHARPVRQLFLDGTVLVDYPSVKEAASTVGCSACLISLCVGGHKKTAAGFRWEYVKAVKPGRLTRRVHRLDSEGNLQSSYNSLTSAAKAMNVSKAAIWSSLTGRAQSAAGWKWAYADEEIL